MERVVVSPVLEILSDTATHLETELRGGRYVASIEECMEVAPQQEPIVDSMLTADRVGSNVSRFQNGQHAFTRYCTAPLVGVGHEHAECTLPETRRDENRI